jgi:hypothetical protein
MLLPLTPEPERTVLVPWVAPTKPVVPLAPVVPVTVVPVVVP